MTISLRRTIQGCLVLVPALLLAACASAPQETPGSSMQNECVQIADRQQREQCLEEAAFGRRP